MTDPIAICNCIQCPILTQYQTTQMISLDYASTFELGPFSANTQYQTTQMISLDYVSTFELGPFSANMPHDPLLLSEVGKRGA